jgi:enhancing lycopene biosynthesis protein 2
MTSKDKSTVKLVIFNGKSESWDHWEFGFIARAVIYKYDEILSGDETSPTQAAYKALDKASTDADVKQLIVNYKANSLAYSRLVSSMDMKGDSCRVAIGLLRNCRTTNFPAGDAFKAMNKLRNYYNNKSVATIQSLLKDYNKCSIKNGQDPSDYMCILDNLRAKITEIDPQETISDKSFTLKLLNSLPLSYVSIIEEIEKDINRGEVRNLLHLKWQRITKPGKSTTSTTTPKTGDDVLLYAGGFKGKCNNCGKYGHKSAACRSKQNGTVGGGGTTTGSNNNNRNSSSNRSTSTVSTFTNTQVGGNSVCNYCKKTGHWKNQCSVLKAKQASGTGGGNSTTQQSERAEVVLTVVEW